MTISEIFEELLARKRVATKSEFSTRFLRRAENYLSVCDSRSRHPSDETLVRLARALCAPDLRDLQEKVVLSLLKEDAKCQ